MIRIGSALFNADHGRLAEELRRTEGAGIDFFHLDVFDGYFVPDQAFPARTIKTLRPLTKLPFEVHLAVNDPVRFLPQLAEAGTDLVYLPAEATPLLYETIYAVREKKMKVGLCLALGTPLHFLSATLPMIDSVLLLGRVTGEGKRGRDFNQLVIERVREVRSMIDTAGLKVDLQAAGGLETESCVEVCRAGARALPLGSALHREADQGAYLSMLREQISQGMGEGKLEINQSQTSRNGNFQVLIASRSFGKHCPETIEKMKQAGAVFMPHSFDKPPTEEQMIGVVANADVIVSGTEPITARVLAAAPKLKVIAKHGVGYDNIDLEAARARNIPVGLAGPVMNDSVSDLAFGLLLAIARKIPQATNSVKAGKWERFVGPELRDKTLGIVGFGQIGKAMARRAKGFGLNLLAYDTYQDHAFAASWGVRYVELEELLRESDFVSLHAPLSAKTRQLINAERLRLMKRSAFLINTARGELIDEQALFEALRDGVIAGAAADVFVKEPPGNNPLLTQENFIGMAHCGGQTHEALRKMGEVTGENILRVVRGEKPLYQL